jgi:hypothetical protein
MHTCSSYWQATAQSMTRRSPTLGCTRQWSRRTGPTPSSSCECHICMLCNIAPCKEHPACNGVGSGALRVMLCTCPWAALDSTWDTLTRLLSLASAAVTEPESGSQDAAPQVAACTECSKPPLQPTASAAQGHVIAVRATLPPLRIPHRAIAQRPASMQLCSREHTIAENAAARPCSPLC